MITHIIEFEGTQERMPWPVGIDHDWFAVTGLTPDLNNTSRLIGFGPAGEQKVTVFAGEAIDNPKSVVGMTPTFSDGNMFLWNIPVREFRAVKQR